LDVVVEGHQYAIYIPLGKSLYMLRDGAACQHGPGDYNVIDDNTLMMVRRVEKIGKGEKRADREISNKAVDLFFFHRSEVASLSRLPRTLPRCFGALWMIRSNSNTAVP
jgi:hypothetical protein